MEKIELMYKIFGKTDWKDGKCFWCHHMHCNVSFVGDDYCDIYGKDNKEFSKTLWSRSYYPCSLFCDGKTEIKDVYKLAGKEITIQERLF